MCRRHHAYYRKSCCSQKQKYKKRDTYYNEYYGSQQTMHESYHHKKTKKHCHTNPWLKDEVKWDSCTQHQRYKRSRSCDRRYNPYQKKPKRYICHCYEK